MFSTPHPTPNKKLGQHFLHDEVVAQRIVATLQADKTSCKAVIEIGPGTGALTRWLVKSVQHPLYLVELDKRLTSFLAEKYGNANTQIIQADFLSWSLQEATKESVAIIGNFPYNISSQIFFKILNHRAQVGEVVCMIQEEVAQRLTTPPGSKVYGLLSVLLQAFYKVSYCFGVPPTCFTPPPKVHSGVIRLVRNEVEKLDCDEKLFFQVVKAGFQQRRKMLRNALKSLGKPLENLPPNLLSKRAEALGVADFVLLTQKLEETARN